MSPVNRTRRLIPRCILTTPACLSISHSLCSKLEAPTITAHQLADLQIGMCVELKHPRLFVPSVAELDLRNLRIESLSVHVDPTVLKKMDLSGCNALHNSDLHVCHASPQDATSQLLPDPWMRLCWVCDALPPICGPVSSSSLPQFKCTASLQCMDIDAATSTLNIGDSSSSSSSSSSSGRDCGDDDIPAVSVSVNSTRGVDLFGGIAAKRQYSVSEPIMTAFRIQPVLSSSSSSSASSSSSSHHFREKSMRVSSSSSSSSSALQPASSRSLAPDTMVESSDGRLAHDKSGTLMKRQSTINSERHPDSASVHGIMGNASKRRAEFGQSRNKSSAAVATLPFIVTESVGEEAGNLQTTSKEGAFRSATAVASVEFAPNNLAEEGMMSSSTNHSDMPVKVGSGGGAYGQAGGGGGKKRSLLDLKSHSDSDSPEYTRGKSAGSGQIRPDRSTLRRKQFYDYEVVICGTQLTAAAFPSLRPESIKGGGDPLNWGSF